VDAEIDESTITVLGQRDSAAPPLYVLVGDSHGKCLRETLSDVSADEGVHGYSFVSGTVPFLDCRYNPEGKMGPEKVAVMIERNQNIFDYVVDHKIPNVIMAFRQDITYHGTNGDWLVDDTHTEEADRKLVFAIHFTETIRRYREAGVTVWYLSQAPKQRSAVPAMLAAKGTHVKGIPLVEYDFYQHHVELMATGAGAIIIDTRPYWFTDDGYSRLHSDWYCNYIDDDHPSNAGTRQYKPLLRQVIRHMKQ
jgi:hypothetical protein